MLGGLCGKSIKKRRKYMTISHSGRRDLVIINRSFWPIYPVIGEALLQFAEIVSNDCSVSVIMQDHSGIREQLDKHQRGANVEFFPCKAWSNSSSRVVVRAFDAFLFMCWVFVTLLRSRPKMVYVSTDPPVLVPFIVMVYACVFRSSYIYHLQDIHPEAANVVVRVHPIIFRFLQWIDIIVMKKASVLITVTEDMANEIRRRSGVSSQIHVVTNPAVSYDLVNRPREKISGVAFCGNAGRLQRISLVLEGVSKYLDTGGTLRFAFAGGGIYAGEIRVLAEKYNEVRYFGQISATEAAQINCNYQWALLPIEDEVTRYAFPSKSSCYLLAEANIFAICGENTSVAKWVKGNDIGIVVRPKVWCIVKSLREIEAKKVVISGYRKNYSNMIQNLSFDHFIERLRELILPGEKFG